MSDAASLRPFDYPAFIEGLKQLRDQVDTFEEEDRDHGAPVFVRWLDSLKYLLDKVDRLGFRHVICRVQERQFTAPDRSEFKTPKIRRIYFDRGLSDTLVEIDRILWEYKNFGEPLRSQEPLHTATGAPGSAASTGTEEKSAGVQEKYSYGWWRDHFPLPLLLSVLVVIAGAFGLGLTMGGTKGGRMILEYFQPDSAASAASTAVQKR